jgi:hypothetical protein
MMPFFSTKSAARFGERALSWMEAPGRGVLTTNKNLLSYSPASRAVNLARPAEHLDSGRRGCAAMPLMIVSHYLTVAP